MAGCSALRNVPEEALGPFLLIEAPRLLFPFARQIVAEAVSNAGFPPLLLDPIDFGAAYMAQLQAAQDSDGGEATAPRPGTGRHADRRLTRRAAARPMNLHKATGTIGGLTMVSRMLGFAREMSVRRVMGASGAADAFYLAFLLPNTFRRLFGEGAFQPGSCRLFARRLGDGRRHRGRAAASPKKCWRCSCRRCSLFTVDFRRSSCRCVVAVVAAG